MESTNRTSVREISPGTFRVSTVRGRSALTGRFVTKATAERRSRTTVTETSNGRGATIRRSTNSD